MRRRITVGSSLAALVLTLSAAAGEPVKSGPQVGEKCTPFAPLNVTGRFAGEERCLVWANGDKPVAVVFARETSASVASLVKKLDAATAKHAQAEMCSFVVFCGDADRKELEKKVKEFAAKEKIAHTELAIDAAAGPEEYKIAKEADVTVLLYVNKTVKANFAFKKGDLTDKEIDKVLAALPKILEP